MSVTTNDSQRLFVIPAGPGYSCLGFDVCYERACALASALGEPAPRPEERGTIEQYMEYQALVDKARNHDLGTWFEPGTPDGVKSALELARRRGVRVRLFFGDSATGRDWLEEWDVTGTVSRSLGPLKTPILIANRRSHGGGAILTRHVVRVIEIESRRELYRHPDYHLPVFTIRQEGGNGPRYMVYADGRSHAGFATKKKATQFVAFMRGERFAK
ncbi:hypothetical protein [Thioalkalivibrio sp. ALgr3]|uniref:hypothetical protein n=1 Tax=Thioalkalivibrio sp. ALgr3 TaxID=1239292 RepID=UPI000373BB84|nr:hypothetical protein [Thioalkalivibrio sp. ALgr3]